MANGVPTVLTFRDILDAQAAAALLEAEGIECVLANEYLIGMVWTYSTAVGGVQLQVAPDQAEEARALLEADESASLAEVESEFPVRRGDDACSRCGSDDLTIIRWSRYAVAAMLFVPLPLFIWRTRVKCRSCGNEWKPAARGAEMPQGETGLPGS
jgi:Putative prokaryotic signal transducing protein